MNTTRYRAEIKPGFSPSRTSSVLFILLFTLTAECLAAAATVAKVLHVQGVVSAQGAGQEARLLSQNAPVFEGDTVTTGSKSFVVLDFIDGAKTTLRPDSVFVIEAYQLSEGREQSALALLKGGLRSLTGKIGKRRPDSYRVRTPVATIGIRGTEYDTRLCDADCAAEAQNSASSAAVPPGLYVGVYDGTTWLGTECVQAVAPSAGAAPSQECGARVEVPAGTGAYTDGRELVSLPTVPVFMTADPLPRPSGLDPAALEGTGRACRVE